MILFLLDDLPTTRGSLGAAATPGIFLRVTLDTPVENIVVLVALANKEVSEELAEVRIIGLVVKAKSTGVVQKYAKFIGKATAKEIGRCGHLLLHDTVILLLFSSGLETLPGECTAEEIHENISKRLEVISASLLNAKVSVDGSVTSSTSQVLVLSVRNMEVGLRIAEFLCQTEINDIDLVTPLSDTHQEVIGFDISVDEVAGVDIFNAGNLERT